MNYKFLLPVLVLVLVLVLVFISCDDEDPIYSPKPRGYCRINFPKKEYRLFDTTCPYQFEIPKYSRIVGDNRKDAQPCWYNIEFPQFRATLHLSYKPVSNNISNFIDTSHYFALKHQIKATGMDETPILRDSSKVYGLLFDIGGNTASSLQFYLTDSTRHFLRGSLYFNVVPNIDSLKIVVDFIRQDVLHLINTTRWKR
ncbi:MAG: gliding motility lipoprotein GldD [Bacteroidia bacterium]